MIRSCLKVISLRLAHEPMSFLCSFPLTPMCSLFGLLNSPLYVKSKSKKRETAHLQRKSTEESIGTAWFRVRLRSYGSYSGQIWGLETKDCSKYFAELGRKSILLLATSTNWITCWLLPPFMWMWIQVLATEFAIYLSPQIFQICYKKWF